MLLKLTFRHPAACLSSGIFLRTVAHQGAAGVWAALAIPALTALVLLYPAYPRATSTLLLGLVPPAALNWKKLRRLARREPPPSRRAPDPFAALAEKIEAQAQRLADQTAQAAHETIAGQAVQLEAMQQKIDSQLEMIERQSTQLAQLMTVTKRLLETRPTAEAA